MPAWIPARLRHLAKPGASPTDTTLLTHFEKLAQARDYSLSEGQRQVIDCMAAQLARLARGEARSLYLHGSVGRGKSWLLDGFFAAVPLERKKRLHFHDFFGRLHQGMHRHRSQSNPLGVTLDELIGDCQVLCFDEFHVHDIGDAMLLTRLFGALFERGLFVLLTSNYAPEGLLPNPLYHERFEPVIRLIETRMLVLEVGGDVDFRTLPAHCEQQRFTQGCYAWPADSTQRQALGVPSPQPVQLEINRRPLRALYSAERQVMFAFEDLCERPTAVIDYLALTERYDDWILDGLDDLANSSLAAQQRFVNLVDVLYDQDKRLLVLARHSLAESLGGTVADLMRTRSRLGQLQQHCASG
ncbi:cell division protein ZapE [Pseudomonas sp. S75]|uniref:cell division protein ZapE n=1 Tax=unclassified Pseudomonas TaxID=196821 RepID=UPI001905E9AC|nr:MULTISPECIES: cell division protein ZapE [unclassified Pseudomonas]MBJ9976398.1 cell division protein ZapE [Pseudomonas sp. S30]MBK0154490.1 cell division protein ZapE [Pseudomonas sp. S75]